eukprot:7229195-Pyramimonas_sp.AAC.1
MWAQAGRSDWTRSAIVRKVPGVVGEVNREQGVPPHVSEGPRIQDIHVLDLLLDVRRHGLLVLEIQGPQLPLATDNRDSPLEEILTRTR